MLKDSGIQFSEDELIYVDPNECEPWEFANRQSKEMGDIEGLMASIKKDKQLQAALIRIHPTPHDNIKYEIMFGRRRHQACLNLDIPLLVIKKDKMTIEDAISYQHAKNKCRDDISPYSDAINYQKLLDTRSIKTQSKLAKSLNMTPQSLNNLLSFNRIPNELISTIPNPYKLSVNMAMKIVQLIEKDSNNLNTLLRNAALIGESICSSGALDKLCAKASYPVLNKDTSNQSPKIYTLEKGEKLFSFKKNSIGMPIIILDKKIANIVDTDDFCERIKRVLQEEILS